jgi:Predicted membrane protein (DUF2254)
MGSFRKTWLLWLTPLAATIAVTVVLLLFGRAADLWLNPDARGALVQDWLLVEDPEVARDVILNVLQVVAGIFAIMITVVAIIVQLSATRYTSRVVDLFLADPINVLIFFVYVVPLIYGMWLSNVLEPGTDARLSAGLFVVLATLAVVLVIPYFQYVFVFLQPRHIIEKIEISIEKSLREAVAGPERIARVQSEVSNSVRQLSDIALSSIAQSDIVLAMHCVDSVRQAATYYVAHKERLPPAWFEVDRNHIVGLSEDMWRDMVARRTWIEMEVFKQYEIAFTSSLRKAHDVNSHVARGLREIAEAGARHERLETVELFIKGLNTFITYALSERDIRSAVHVLYQYRLLGEALLQRAELVRRMAEHLKYYAHNSLRRGIYFIIDAIAYDLRVLIERAFSEHPATADLLLGIFLELDQAAESKEDLARMRGVRKSQAMLAGFFIRAGRLELAKRIHDDMAAETREFLAGIRQELFATQSREFWEIEDRGVSFYYVEEPHRESVTQFFAWLLGERPLPREIAQSA